MLESAVLGQKGSTALQPAACDSRLLWNALRTTPLPVSSLLCCAVFEEAFQMFNLMLHQDRRLSHDHVEHDDCSWSLW